MRHHELKGITLIQRILHGERDFRNTRLRNFDLSEDPDKFIELHNYLWEQPFVREKNYLNFGNTEWTDVTLNLKGYTLDEYEASPSGIGLPLTHFKGDHGIFTKVNFSYCTIDYADFWKSTLLACDFTAAKRNRDTRFNEAVLINVKGAEDIYERREINKHQSIHPTNKVQENRPSL